MKLIKVVFLGLFITCGLIHTAESIQAQHMPIINKNIVMTLPIVAALIWLSIVLHEFGHAITHYVFTGKFPHIVIGDYQEDPYINTPVITINSFSPWASGGVFVGYERNSSDEFSLRKIFTYFNGSLFGVATFMVVNYVVLHKIFNPTWIDQLTIRFLIVAEVMFNLWPVCDGNFKNDGYKLLQALGINDQTLNAIGDDVATFSSIFSTAMFLLFLQMALVDCPWRHD